MKDILSRVENTIHCRIDELEALRDANLTMTPEVERTFLKGLLQVIDEANGVIDGIQINREEVKNRTEPERAIETGGNQIINIQ